VSPKVPRVSRENTNHAPPPARENLEASPELATRNNFILEVVSIGGGRRSKQHGEGGPSSSSDVLAYTHVQKQPSYAFHNTESSWYRSSVP